MQTPLSISFRHMDSSPAIEHEVARRVGDLEKTFPRIIGCDVVIDASQGKQVTGREFQVSVNVRVPGPDIHASTHLGRSTATDDVNLALHRAFDAAERTLREQGRRMSHVETKQHPDTLHGEIDRLFANEGFGFIAAEDGNEYYFQRDSMVAGRWDELKVGTRVRFRAMDGEKGPFAVSVASG